MIGLIAPSTLRLHVLSDTICPLRYLGKRQREA